MSVPARMTGGSGVRSSNRNHGGVMASRLRAWLKKANTSSIERRTT